MIGYSFTQEVRMSLARAREEAVRLHHEYVGTEHILLGLIPDDEGRDPKGVAAALLQALSLDPGEVREDVEKAVKRGRPTQPAGPDLPYTTSAKKVLEQAMSEARELNHSYVGDEHLLIGLVREEGGVAARVLRARGVTRDVARAALRRVLAATPGPVASTAEVLADLRASRPAAKISIIVAVHDADGRLRHSVSFDSAGEAIPFLDAVRIARGE